MRKRNISKNELHPDHVDEVNLLKRKLKATTDYSERKRLHEKINERNHNSDHILNYDRDERG